uniref:Uncharacterized protein n=1 Tax=Aegilops tauschii subsp. strangulata TaxID=200361 RepID=A0A453GUW1_AEGTS
TRPRRRSSSPSDGAGRPRRRGSRSDAHRRAATSPARAATEGSLRRCCIPISSAVQCGVRPLASTVPYPALPWPVGRRSPFAFHRREAATGGAAAQSAAVISTTSVASCCILFTHES